MSETLHVLDKGSVRLYQHIGDDLSVVNAARVSYGKWVDTMGDGDVKLIHYLLKNNHTTPFEHNSFTFVVKAPIFVTREWMRHRIGSFNEMSARYVTLPAEFYEPRNVRVRVGKPGHYTNIPAESAVADAVVDMTTRANEESYNTYDAMLRQGVAPEVARTVLPVGIYTQFFWTVNAHSMMHFLKLRTHPTAQWEIQRYAKAVEHYFEQEMPHTYAAYRQHWSPDAE